MNRIEKIRDFSKQCLLGRITKEGEEAGWRYEHSEEAFRCTIEILDHSSSHQLKECDLEILEAACLLHDIEKGNDTGETDNHADRGAQAAESIVRELYSNDEAKIILDAIRYHDKRSSAICKDSPYILLLQDADILSKFYFEFVWKKNYKSGRYLNVDNLQDYHKNIQDIKSFVSEKLNFDSSIDILNNKVESVIKKIDEIMAIQYCEMEG